jgi:hypothetical protein
MDKVRAFVEGTRIPEQIHAVDYTALLSNGYFMAPFLLVIGYMIYTKSFKELVLLGMGTGVWISSGTEYMQGLIVDGELQMDKVLPVTFGGAVLLGIVIYMYFGRSD